MLKRNNLKKSDIFSICVLVLIELCLLMLFIYHYHNALCQLPNISQLNYNYASKIEPMTISGMNQLTNRLELEGYTFCSELNEIVSSGEKIVPVLTDENYFDIYHYDIIGNSITSKMITEKDKQAVIGSKLALKLYFNTNAVGKKININGDYFTVCGVYPEYEGLLNNISSDGKNRVYIPYTVAKDYPNQGIDIIACNNSAPKSAIIEQIALQGYHLTDFSEKSKVIVSFGHILLLFFFVILCILSLKFWYKFCGIIYSDIRKLVDKNYFWEAVRQKPMKFILFIISALGIPIVLLFIFYNLDFSVYIVPKYIPDDNIFDIPYYIGTITQNANYINSLALSGNTYRLNIYNTTFYILTIILVFQSFILILAVSKLNRYRL